MTRRTLGAALQGAAAAMPGGQGYQQQTRIEDLLRELGVRAPLPAQPLAGLTPYHSTMIRRSPLPEAPGRSFNSMLVGY
jgi:hypothetical protein